MLRQALFIARHDASRLLRQREALLWVFVMPLLFFYFIGTVTGGFDTEAPAAGVALALEGDLPPGEPLVDALAARLVEQGFVVEREPAAAATAPARTLRVEGSAAAARLGERPWRLTLVHREASPRVQLERVRVARAVYGLLADLVVLAAGQREVDAESLAALHAAPRPLQLELAPAGRRTRIPSGYQQAIPGNMVMFTMLVLLSSGAVALVIEREAGLLRRLASAPISRAAVVLGKWTARMLLGLVQIGFSMLVGRFVFGMDWGPSLAGVLLVLFAWAAFNASLGLWLAGLVRTRAQMGGLGILVTMTLAALGGCWWPIELSPEWMQRLALLLPSGWTMDALHRLVIFQDPALQALPHALALIGSAIAAGAAAARGFRYS